MNRTIIKIQIIKDIALEVTAGAMQREKGPKERKRLFKSPKCVQSRLWWARTPAADSPFINREGEGEGESGSERV